MACLLPAAAGFRRWIGLICGAIVGCILSQKISAAESRIWADVHGRSVKGELIEQTANTVSIRIGNQRVLTVVKSSLSEEDRRYLNGLDKGKNTAPPHSAASRSWPDVVGASHRDTDIQWVEEDKASGRYVYYSKDFEFVSNARLGTTLMREIAQTFEATRALLNALPWGVNGAPPGAEKRYQARLFETYEQYLADGGVDGTSGVYLSRRKMFLVPFRSLGIKKVAGSWRKDKNFTNDTLVHELTHQMMDSYLRFLPIWVIEGTAEYTRILPFRSGTFRVKQHAHSLRDHIKAQERAGLKTEIPSLAKLFAMDTATWQKSPNDELLSLYYQAYLLIYYFCHLDDPPGERFVRYMEKVRHDASDANPLRHRYGGMPENVTPGLFRHADVLLEGRNLGDLARQIQDAYKKIGVRIAVGE